MGLNRIRKRKAEDFIKATLKQRRREEKRREKEAQDIGQEKTMPLKRILTNDLTTVNKEKR